MLLNNISSSQLAFNGTISPPTFRDAIDNTPFMVDSNKHDSENFFMLVYGCIQQAVDVIVSCVEYGCIPYIRYPVALHYISLLSENMLDIDHINKLRYKMSVAFIVYGLCDKNRLATTGFDVYLKKIEEYSFDEKLFTILDEHGINEKNFIEHPVAQIVANELENFYSMLSETEESTKEILIEYIKQDEEFKAYQGGD